MSNQSLISLFHLTAKNKYKFCINGLFFNWFYAINNEIAFNKNRLTLKIAYCYCINIMILSKNKELKTLNPVTTTVE